MNAVSDVVRALMRALKAARFYRPTHSLYRQQLALLLEKLQGACAGGEVVFATNGHALLTPAGPLGDLLSQQLATAMMRRHIVGLCFTRAIQPHEIVRLLQVLLQPPERLQAEGGTQKALPASGGFRPFVVDLRALLQGKLSGIQTEHPLFDQALSELFRGGETVRTGQALGVTFEQVRSAASLGGVLDELLAGAQNNLVQVPSSKNAGAGGSLLGGIDIKSMGQLSADTLAELMSGAFASATAQISQRPSSEGELVAAAEVMSAALARLSPKARFSLLRRLAQGDGSLSALGQALPDPIIVGALAATLTGGKNDAAAAQAIGSVLQRLRPVEADRAKLMQDLDTVSEDQGHAIDGVLWQELHAAAAAGNDQRMAIDTARVMPILTEAAQRRHQVAHLPAVVSSVLHPPSPNNVRDQTSKWLVTFASAPDLAPKIVGAVRVVLQGAQQDAPGYREAIELLCTMTKRLFGTAPCCQLYAHSRGGEWLNAVLETEPGLVGNAGISSLISTVLDRSASAKGQEQALLLLDKLGQSKRRVLRAGISNLSPQAASLLVRLHGHKRGTSEAITLALRAIGSKSERTAAAAIRALAGPAAVTFLSKICGASDDGSTRRALEQRDLDTERLRVIQHAAIAALGECGNSAAPILGDLLLRDRFLAPKIWDEFRDDAALSLHNIGSPAALAFLERGSKSKGAIRRASERVLA